MSPRKTRRRGPAPTALQDLRRRLQEAEDTIAAIREGHVEALVVQSSEGEQVFTLRSADHPYRLMVEQMREGALTIDAEGTILWCNSRFAELVGVPSERITSRSFRDFIAPVSLEVLEPILSKPAFRQESELRTERGPLPALLSSTALEIDGIRTVAVVVSDLTQERTERGLRESNRLKDEFLATLSHELRTPLNVILGWTRMLLLDQSTDSRHRHALELIDRNAQAQAQLVNDLVDMARLSKGKVDLDLASLPVVPAVEGAIESIRPDADAKDITIKTVWRVDDETVLADSTRLQQMLWNLLSNAVKFTPARGRITVTVSRTDGRVRIDVADSGLGIDPDFLPHVFDRFRQADGRTTRAFGGLGLGLAIVRDLVRLHAGDVSASSSGRGKGSTFTVKLPVGVPSRREEPLRAPRAASLTGLRVLVIEDHTDSRELMREVLEGVGATVSAFGTATDALAAIRHVKPSIVIADIGLPDVDGYSLIRQLRSHPSRAIQTLPAIAVTAYAAAADRAAALTAGFQRHLPKPIDSRLLIEAIHEITREQ
jgi:PAS domain S-box-containing protein